MAIALSLIQLCSAVYGLVAALRVKQWISALIASGFIISLVFTSLSPTGLLYHSTAITVSAVIALGLLIITAASGFDKRQRLLAILVALPYVLVSTFKVLQLQGAGSLTYVLFLSIVAFIVFSLDRRTWDHYWAHLLFVALSATWILLQ